MLLIPKKQSRTLDQLREIPVPEERPWAATGECTWQPVQHGELVDTLLGEIDRAGLRCESTHWGVNESETDLFGSVVFARHPEHRLPKGTALSLGLRHSNAGRYALTFGFGAQVLVCTNGVLAAEHIVSRKHVRGVRLDQEIRGGLERFLSQTQQVSDFIATLRATRLSRARADGLLVEAGRSKVLPWSKIGHVDELWRDNPEKAFRARTAWSLYNCFTEVAKRRSAARQFSTQRGLERLFRERSVARPKR